MGIFKHGKHEPGAASQPEGDGPVTLDDRTGPGGQGSPDTNQGKTEPMSPTPDHPEPAAEVPTLEAMNVGSADPQAPSHPAAGGAPAPVTAGRGPQRASGQTGGTSSLTPGSLGEVPEGEAVETDVAAGVSRTTAQEAAAREPLSSGHGVTGPAPAAGDGPAPGSSEEHAVVTGVRTPDAR